MRRIPSSLGWRVVTGLSYQMFKAAITPLVPLRVVEQALEFRDWMALCVFCGPRDDGSHGSLQATSGHFPERYDAGEYKTLL